MQKSILITGCSSGIGLRAAEVLQQRGYRVFATARKVDDVAMLQQKGLESLVLDVNDSTSITVAVKEILKRTQGTLDALFNNAGFGLPGAVEDLTRDNLRTQFETNVFGLQELTNQIIPIMRKQGHGRIINVSSILGLLAMPYRGAYNASKFALEGLTDTLRLELYSSGIFVSLIEPGPIRTNFRNRAQAAYKQNINIEHSIYRENYERMQANMNTNKDNSIFTLTPDAVVKKLIHALENKRPKIRYYVTFPTYALTTLKRLLPYRAFDFIMRQISKQEIK